MTLLVTGLNHATAPVELRERVAFAPEQVADALRRVSAVTGATEALILSTCNRTDLVTVCDDAELAAERTLQWLAHARATGEQELASCIYRWRDADAMRHLIRVASGLDSMVLGEPQIFGQLKAAYQTARNAGMIGSQLGRAVNHAFLVAKRIRTETSIGENPVSVAFAAVKMARHIFSDLASTTALLIGAGETIELVARHLQDAGVRSLIIANRTLARGEQLAMRFGAEAVLLGEIPRHLPRADIVISSTASQLPILGKGAVEAALRARRHRPMFMVDIAVPRDIEPQVGELADVYLYAIDDLEQIVADNRRARGSAAAQAELIVAEGVDNWLGHLRALDAVDTVRDVRGHVDALREQEVARALRQLQGGADPAQVLQALGRGLANKILHGPSVELRRAAAEGRHDFVEWGRRLFGLDDTLPDSDDSP